MSGCVCVWVGVEEHEETSEEDLIREREKKGPKEEKRETMKRRTKISLCMHLLRVRHARSITSVNNRAACRK